MSSMCKSTKIFPYVKLRKNHFSAKRTLSSHKKSKITYDTIKNFYIDMNSREKEYLNFKKMIKFAT